MIVEHHNSIGTENQGVRVLLCQAGRFALCHPDNVGAGGLLRALLLLNVGWHDLEWYGQLRQQYAAAW
jgi:hypothetical protein